MARKNAVLIYKPDDRYYITVEYDGRRRWYRLWWRNYVLVETVGLDMTAIGPVMVERGLDPDRMVPPESGDDESAPHPACEG